MNQITQKAIGTLTVFIERDRCIGTGNCVKVAPEVFELDEQGVCAFRSETGQIQEERVIDACDVCPVDALRVARAACVETPPAPGTL